jgi:hypothetical protein
VKVEFVQKNGAQRMVPFVVGGVYRRSKCPDDVYILIDANDQQAVDSGKPRLYSLVAANGRIAYEWVTAPEMREYLTKDYFYNEHAKLVCPDA